MSRLTRPGPGSPEFANAVAATAAVQAKATQRAIDVVEQGTPFAGGGNAAAGIMASIETAGGKSGAATGATVYTMDKPVTIPAGTFDVGTPILIANSWQLSFLGAGGTETRFRVLNDLSALIALDGCGYGTIGQFAFSDASGHTVQTVFAVDRSAAAANSVHSLYIRDIDIGAGKWVKGIAVGVNSANLDMAQVFLTDLRTTGTWVTGEATLWQEGIHLGNPTFGNVLNFALQNASFGGVAKGIVVDAVNATLRDVFGDGGDIAFSGQGRHYLSVDGWRIEDFNQFCAFTGVDTIHRNYRFSNGNYNDPGAGVHIAANFERAGNVTFANVIWNTQNYSTGARAQIRTYTSPTVGRRLTFRNFLAKERPEELWVDGSNADWKYVWMIFDGYIIGSSSLQAIQEITGLYPRAITASTNVKPYDGILLADTTSAAITATLPPASFHLGREVVLRKTAGANTLTLAATSPDLIDGAASVTVTATTRARSIGTSWMVL